MPFLKYMHRFEAAIRPRIAIRLVRPEGQVLCWAGEPVGDSQLPASGRKVKFCAVELPEDLVLRRSLTLPANLSDADVASAVELDVLAASPFSPADTVWGWWREAGASESATAHVALTGRQHVQDWLAGLGPRLSASDTPEVWAPPVHGRTIVIQGFGEQRRLALGGREIIWSMVLAAVALLLGVAIALSPTLQLRLKALDAVQASDQLKVSARPEVQRRDAIAKSAEQVGALSELVGSAVDPIAVLDFLTRAMPDDTYLLSLRIQGKTATLSGQTTNAAALMKALGGQPGILEVKSPSAATRVLGATREGFVIDLTLDDSSTAGTAVSATGVKP